MALIASLEFKVLRVTIVQVQRLEGALAVASASVEGTIQGITFENKQTGYRVLKVAALHTAGEPPEQRIKVAKMPARTAKGTPLFILILQAAMQTFMVIAAKLEKSKISPCQPRTDAYMQMLNAALQQRRTNAGPYYKHRHSIIDGQR